MLEIEKQAKKLESKKKKIEEESKAELLTNMEQEKEKYELPSAEDARIAES